ncbi:copper-binding protein [Sphingomonas sp. GV3]|uniref:copper-binding protein n=1 Tax=Sphingomonas sp. GV3 TaxID=3040671 RepID=UPI00280BC720|nr:copper-binding protein [Sphingomonas sp. GV3]
MFTTILSLSPVAAQVPEGQSPHRIDIELSSFRFRPERIVLHAGQRYLLHLSNGSSGSHDFTAKAFFAAATIDPRDAGRIAAGGVALRRGEVVDLRLTAPATRSYEVHCSHFLRTTFGMKGEIVVE